MKDYLKIYMIYMMNARVGDLNRLSQWSKFMEGQIFASEIYIFVFLLKF